MRARLLLVLLLLASPAWGAVRKYNWRVVSASASPTTRIPVYNIADTKASLGAVSGPLEGDLGYAQDTDLLYYYTGAAWTLITEINAKTMLAGDYTNETAAFTNTALSVSVTAGRSYTFIIHAFVSDSVAADGAQFDFEGSSATITNFRATCSLADTALLFSTEVTALATDMTQATVTGAAHLECAGTIEPSGSGTLLLRAAQVAHTTGTLTIARGSFLWIADVTP